jgi:hypothetical protein
MYPDDRLAAIARSVTLADTHRPAPPPGLWDAISARLDEPQAVAPAETERAPVDPSDAGPVAAPVSLDAERRRRRRGPWVVGAVAAVVALLVGVVGISTLGSGDEGVVVASAPIGNTFADQSLPVASTATGTAEVVETDDGLVLRLDVEGLDGADEPLEVWLIDTDVAGMHSLGFVAGDGQYVLPAGIDPADFPIVDISVEPVDGDPTHSGNSVLRGQLDFA